MSHTDPASLITIGITCYNAQDSIERALTSARKQTWDNKEIIIVDDQSTDDSIAIIKAAIKDQSHIRLIQHDINQGPAGARQTIINNANGDFIVFFDDDDESLPHRLEKQYQRLTAYEVETGEKLVACYASGIRVYPNGYIAPLEAIGSRPHIPHGANVADRLLFYGGDQTMFFGSGTPTCGLMTRKSTFEAAGGFDLAFRRVEDVDFSIRLALAGGHFIGCPDELFIQYATGGADKAPEKNLAAEQQLAEKHKDYLLSVGRYKYARDWPLLRYHHFRGEYFKMIALLAKLFIHAPIKTTGHFMKTATRRFFHERKMRAS